VAAGWLVLGLGDQLPMREIAAEQAAKPLDARPRSGSRRHRLRELDHALAVAAPGELELGGGRRQRQRQILGAAQGIEQHAGRERAARQRAHDVVVPATPTALVLWSADARFGLRPRAGPRCR